MSDDAFRLPRDDERSVIIGKNGTGKTVAAAWQLSLRSYDTMPWVIVDAKGDRLLNRLGAKEIKPGFLPRRAGLYITHPRPDELDTVDAMLWEAYNRRVDEVKHRRPNNTRGCGWFFDEGYFITGSSAFQAVLTRGRSLNIPCITLTQRPVWLDRFVFSEADHIQYFWVQDRRDRKTVQEFLPIDADIRLPKYHSTWYNLKEDQVSRLSPVPSETDIIRTFKQRLGQQRQLL